MQNADKLQTQTANIDRLQCDRRSALKRLSLFTGLIALNGCALTREDSIVRDHFGVAKDLIASRGEGGKLKLEEVAKYPYASMAIRMGSSREQLIFLSRFEGKKLFWISGDNVVLVTHGGRLIQTSGLLRNLKSATFNANDPVQSGLLTADKQERVWYLDYDDGLGIAIRAKSKFRVVKKDPIDVLGTTLPTVLVEEKVRVPFLKWRFKNKYWVHEQSQFIWRTKQYFHPEGKPFTLTTLRPASLPT